MFGSAKNEIELLKASLRGKPQAFGVLVGKYQSLICAITYSATGNVEKSEELAQETFLLAWKSLGQLQDLSKFRPWLCRIARNTVQNWFRSLGRDRTGRAAPLEAAADKPSDDMGPAETAMSREQQAIVSQVLAEIPQNLREPLILFYREQQSTREVALQLGLSESAARQRISRARAMLRAQVADVVENSITRTKPGKAFKTAVIAAIAGTAARTGTATAATSLLGLGGKIALTAAGIAVLVGVVSIYRQTKPTDPPVTAPQAVESTPQASPEADETTPSTEAGAPAIDEAAPGAAAALARADVGSESPIHAEVPPARRAASLEALTPPFEFKPKGVFSGVVTDAETGEPVPNAMVMISSGRGRTVRTDAHGFYSFDTVPQAGNFNVSVDALTHVGIPQSRDNLVVNLDNHKQVVKHFQLPKACMVDVWVVDANGVGIAEARVTVGSLLDDYGRAPGHFADRRSTDPNGYVLLGGIPPGTMDYLITAWHTVEVGREQLAGGATLRRTAFDYAPGKIVTQLPDPNVIPQVTIVLEDGQDVSGYAEYADGVPAAGIWLIRRPAWWHSIYGINGPQTAADGTFTFKHVTPGSYQISRFVPHFDGGGTTRAVTQVQLPPADGAPLVIRIPEKSPQALVSISGTITFVGSKTPGYIRVEAYSTGVTTSTRATRAADGTTRFELKNLEPGKYTLTFSGTDIEDKTVRDVVAPTSDLAVEMVCTPKPKLAGAVLDAATGVPIQRFRARARKQRSLRGAPYVLRRSWADFDDERGAFSLDTVGPGIYEVQVWAQDYAPRWSDPINTDENGSVTVALTRGGTVTGTAVDEDGQVITGAKVTPLSTAGGVMPQTKDAFTSQDGTAETLNGAFTLDHLPPGIETLKATHPDYAFSIVEDVVVREGSTTTGVAIVLTEGATVQGHVYDYRGRPQAGQTLFFQDAQGYGDSNFEQVRRLASAVTDSNGFYQVAHLPEEVCYVKRTTTARTLGVVRRAVAPRAGAVTRLDFGGTPIVAGVVVLKGQPQAKTKLMLIPADAAEVRLFTAYAMTDKDGAFAFGGVAPGVYAIHCQNADKRRNWLKIATIEVAGSDVDLGAIPTNTSTLRLALEGLSPNASHAIERVFLADPDRAWPTPVRFAEAPAGRKKLRDIHDVEPGTYKLVLERADRMQWRRQITLQAGPEPWTVSMELPHATARVTGRIAGISEGSLTFYREGKDLFGILRADSSGHFTVENLPAGKYAIGPGMGLLYDVPALVEFTLAAGEHRTVDLDFSDPLRRPMSFVMVQVLDASGRARRDARLWLQGPSGTVGPTGFNASGHAFVATPGAHRLHVELPGYRRIERNVTLDPASPTGASPQHIQICLGPL